MIELVWIRIRDDANPIEVLQRAHDAMGDDGHIIALKPEDNIEAKEGHVEINYKTGDGGNIIAIIVLKPKNQVTKSIKLPVPKDEWEARAKLGIKYYLENNYES